MAAIVVLDTNVIVALIDAHDTWHSRAVALRDILEEVGAEVVYFDCVINEAVGVMGRRAEEQKRADQFQRLVERLTDLVPESSVTWIAGAAQRLFREIMNLCSRHEGALNFHDALIALACQEIGTPFIVSFDADFDRIAWLTRMSDSARLRNLRESSKN
jgi:predicted nucleic acid-binding protein